MLWICHQEQEILIQTPTFLCLNFPIKGHTLHDYFHVFMKFSCHQWPDLGISVRCSYQQHLLLFVCRKKFPRLDPQGQKLPVSSVPPLGDPDLLLKSPKPIRRVELCPGTCSLILMSRRCPGDLPNCSCHDNAHLVPQYI